MGAYKIAGSVLMAGSILFLIAGFSPITRIFGEPDAVKRLEILTNELRAWTVSQILFATGALVTAAGLAMAAYQLRGTPGAGWAYLGAAAFAIGAVFWSWHVYLRAHDPRAFVEGTLPAWHFAAYTLLTQAGLAAVGVALLRSGLPVWVGWVLIGGSLILCAVYLVFKDVPPFVYYLLTLIAGIMVYRMGA